MFAAAPSPHVPGVSHLQAFAMGMARREWERQGLPCRSRKETDALKGRRIPLSSLGGSAIKKGKAGHHR